MRESVALASVLLCVLASGCGSGGGDHGAAPPTTTAAAPVAESALDSLLLTPAEAGTALGVNTGMTVAKTLTKMDDGTGAVDLPVCLPVYATALNAVYGGSGYTAVRNSYVTETTPDAPNSLDQAVVLFPSADQAAAFYRSAVQRWSACSNHQFIAANSNVSWSVGQSTEADGTLSVPETQHNGDKGDCQRALTARNNVVVDVTACDRAAPTTAGIPASRAIAAKIRS